MLELDLGLDTTVPEGESNDVSSGPNGVLSEQAVAAVANTPLSAATAILIIRDLFVNRIMQTVVRTVAR